MTNTARDSESAQAVVHIACPCGEWFFVKNLGRATECGKCHQVYSVTITTAF